MSQSDIFSIYYAAPSLFLVFLWMGIVVYVHVCHVHQAALRLLFSLPLAGWASRGHMLKATLVVTVIFTPG